eukprot:CAMPEP_0114598364 /NCGR_PEP_ID=MMETSP0125-20121206/20684_1 /TAXON_ID=485358 ORGANISM="Aristerostoma sp., Strain ATCC 50986" /NCGR_SAMPLE_ID=MMETSP0125 /ASSEMBLY_ACC=CAM_ASM_000245 /LENGTH=153 /DNA_ID=CAMNT_0001803921 /DNA_START=2773 /DNA_END=3234 /DNA_ORIENTATION=+
MKVNIVNLDATFNPTIVNDATATPLLKQNEIFYEIIEVLLNLASHVENRIAEKSLQCLLNIFYLFGSIKKDKYVLKPDQVVQILMILAGQGRQQLWKKASKVVLWGAFLQDNNLSVPADKKTFIMSLLDKHKSSEDKTIAYCATNLKNYITSK